MNFTLILTAVGIAILLANGFGVRRPALALITFFLIFSHFLPLLTTWIAHPVWISSTSGAYDQFILISMNIAAISTLVVAIGYSIARLVINYRMRRGRSILYSPIGAVNPIKSSVSSNSMWRFSPVQLAHLFTTAILLTLVLVQPLGPLGFAKLALTRVPFEGFIFALIYVAACVNAVTCCIWMIISLRTGRYLPWVSIILSLIIFFALGGRIQLIITALSYALVYASHRRVKIAPIILGIIFLAVLFNATLFIRLTLQGGQGITYVDTLMLNVSQASALDGYAFAERFVREVGHKPMLYVDSLRLLVPRFLDPEKPEQLSRLMRLMVSRDRLGGLTNGVFGELYVIGGYGVLMLGSLIYGIMIALLDRAFQSGRLLSAPNAAFVFVLIPILTLYVTRGGLDVAIFRIASVAATVAVALAVLAILDSVKVGGQGGAGIRKLPTMVRRGGGDDKSRA